MKKYKCSICSSTSFVVKYGYRNKTHRFFYKKCRKHFLINLGFGLIIKCPVFQERFLRLRTAENTIEDKMNNAPRKCLGYKTPKEYLFELLKYKVTYKPKWCTSS